MDGFILREERAADAEAISRLTEAAFAGAEHSSGTEAAIIVKLRAAGQLTLSLVAEEAGVLLGHVAFSPVLIAGKDHGWFGLGPVSVAPDAQRRGIGKSLIREGLARIKTQGAKGCVVLGDPAYYARFGFAPKAGLTFEGVPPEYFMALDLSGERPQGPVTYHPAFYEG